MHPKCAVALMDKDGKFLLHLKADQYFFKEGLEECLEANDYTIIKGNPMEEI